jgi:hypothetical protein
MFLVLILLLLSLLSVVPVGGALTNFAEKKLLDHALGTASWTMPTQCYVGLSTTTPVEGGTNFTEPAGGWYARQSADFDAATQADPTYTANTSAVAFGNPTENGTVTHFGIFDAVTGGNLLFFGALGASVTYQAAVDETLTFAAGALDVTLD